MTVHAVGAETLVQAPLRRRVQWRVGRDGMFEMEVNMDERIRPRSARSSVKDCNGLGQFFFLRTTEELLREAVEADKAEVDAMKQELALMEPARLYAHKVKDSYHFGSFDEGSRRESGITGDSARIHELARRTYLKCRIRTIEEIAGHFEALLEELAYIRKRAFREARLGRFAEAGLDLSRILFSKEQNEWIDATYLPDPYHRNSLKWPTKNGLLTRSKSEGYIGSFFEDIGLPYRCDDLVEIRGGGFGGAPHKDTYFADFKVPNLSGGITVHEHFGAFQMDEYSINALKRLDDYHNFTVIELPGRVVKHNEFTWSFESDLRDDYLFSKVIRRMLLPGSAF